MATKLEDWKAFLSPSGPFHVQHEDGAPVSYGTRAKARAHGDVAQVKSLADIELILYDELGNEQRAILGPDVIRFETEAGPGVTVVVEDSVEPDPGDTVKTRG